MIVRTGIEEATPRLVHFAYRISSADDGRLLAEGFTRHVFCGRDRRARKLPEKYHFLFGVKACSQPNTGLESN